MTILTHKLGMVLGLDQPVDTENRRLIEETIAATTGVVSADFSVDQADMVVVEYDPYVTSPTELHQNIRDINPGAVLRTVFVSRPPADEEAETT